jgi:hypothetical protein
VLPPPSPQGRLVEQGAVELQAGAEKEVLAAAVLASHRHPEHLEPVAEGGLQGEVSLGIGRGGGGGGGVERDFRAMESDPNIGVWSLGLQLPVAQLMHLQGRGGGGSRRPGGEGGGT